MGTVTLTEKEALGLDQLLKFYRTPHGAGCTTVDKISLTQTNGKKTENAESFIDDSCATYQMKDVTLFTGIAAKLKPKN